jgi:DNA-directed RNA polymerase subunit RPC12/RpoP
MWQIEHQCPQCGASTHLEETDRLFTCPYCRVKLYIAAGDSLRYFLPSRVPNGEETLYVPYHRFKGMSFSYEDGHVRSGLVDVSHNASGFDMFPSSLGLRSQTQKLRFVSVTTKGSFLEPVRSLHDVLSLNGHLSETDTSIPKRAYIGESLSLIFSPIYVKDDSVYDGIVNEKISVLTDQTCTDLIGGGKKGESNIAFIPSLCPNCGWNLDGEPESVILTCKNCGSAWGATGNGFENVSCSFLPLPEEDLLYLPFWKIEAEVTGIPLASYADFLRLCNLPKISKKEWEETPFYLLTPAFKITPAFYLKLSQGMTLAPFSSLIEDELPQKSLYPVTMPLKESFECLKMLIAYCAVSKKEITSHFDAIQLELKNARLIYWPFYASSLELVRSDRQFSISASALKWGKKL